MEYQINRMKFDEFSKEQRLETLTKTIDILYDKRDIRIFNLFFKGLNEMHLNPTMEIYHKYYLKLVTETQTKPNIITFNTLLKAVRLSNPSRFKFTQYFLNEMDKYNIPYDGITINEIITLCAKHPENPNNIQAANNWFNYYLSNIFDKASKSEDPRQRGMRKVVFVSYMHLYAKIGNIDVVKTLHNIAKEKDVWSPHLQRTYNIAMKLPIKFGITKEKSQGRSWDDTEEILN